MRNSELIVSATHLIIIEHHNNRHDSTKNSLFQGCFYFQKKFTKKP